MPRVVRCDECRGLFELPEGQAPEEVDQVQSAGLVRVTKVFLCPPCRQGARQRGQPPAPPGIAPPLEAIAETEAAGPPAATGPEGQPTHEEQPQEEASGEEAPSE